MPDQSDVRSRVAAVCETAPFNTWLGIEVEAAAEGDVELRLRFRPEFAQYNGFLHASIVAGLIDTVCGFAAFTIAGYVLTSQFSVRCLRPAVAAVFVAKGKVLKPGRQQIFASAELYALGAPEKLFAAGDAILVPTSSVSTSPAF